MSNLKQHVKLFLKRVDELFDKQRVDACISAGDQSKGGKNRKPFILTIFVIIGLIGLIVLIALGCWGYYQYGKAKQEQYEEMQKEQILKRKLERQLMQYEKSGSRDGHDYVDLGLPSGLKWATCNVGADSPEKYGDYYAWGETVKKSSYTKDNSETYGYWKLEDFTGNAKYDAARANWGGKWRMPTDAEMRELLDECTWTYARLINGVVGYKVTGPNGNSIFLPAAGYRDGSSLNYAENYGRYWSSMPYDDYYYAYALYINATAYNSDEHYMVDDYRRYLGLSVRPVIE